MALIRSTYADLPTVMDGLVKVSLNGTQMYRRELFDNGRLVDTAYAVITVDGEEVYAGPDRAKAESEFKAASIN